MFRTRFFIEGIPKAKPRARARVIGGHPGVYQPDTADDWLVLVMAEAGKHRPKSPLEGPVGVSSTFYFPRPKRLLRKKDPRARIPHAAKPDRDNLDKLILDALKQLSYYRDDSQAWVGMVMKWYVSTDPTFPRPGAFVEIWTPDGRESF